MPILEKPEKLVVDANAILSALLGGKSKRLFFEAGITEFAVADSVLEEVQAYVPKMARKLGVGHEFLFYALELLPLTICAPKMYRRSLQKAKMQIAHRDPREDFLLRLLLLQYKLNHLQALLME